MKKDPFGIAPIDPQTSLRSVYLRVSLSNVQDKTGQVYPPNVSILATFELRGPGTGVYAKCPYVDICPFVDICPYSIKM